jgi:hypothetical protein
VTLLQANVSADTHNPAGAPLFEVWQPSLHLDQSTSLARVIDRAQASGGPDDGLYDQD